MCRGGRKGGGLNCGHAWKKIMTQSFCALFFGDFSSPDFAVSGSVLLGGQVGTTGSLEPCPICVDPAKPAQSE